MQISLQQGRFSGRFWHSSTPYNPYIDMDEMSTVKPRIAMKDKPEVLVIMILATWEIYLTVRVQE